MKAYLVMGYWIIRCEDWCDGRWCSAPESIHKTREAAEKAVEIAKVQNPSKYKNCTFEIIEMDLDES